MKKLMNFLYIYDGMPVTQKEAYSEPCQKSKTELRAIVNPFLPNVPF